MIDAKKIVVVILARGGSKRLPKKNVRKLGDKPLIAWTIDAAKESKYVDRIIVSTDSSEIAEIAGEYGADVLDRPENLATDEATSESGVLHALEWITKNENKTFDYVALLQPTSPLRTAKHLDEAVAFFHEKGNADTLVSVTVFDKNPYWLKRIDKDGFLESYFDSNSSPKVKETVSMPNGAIFLARVPSFMRNKKFYTKRTIGYVMEKKVSIDIDEEFDFNQAEFLQGDYPCMRK
jgi:CMP-N,N'-diacetyllegionaminic acid synthase